MSVRQLGIVPNPTNIDLVIVGIVLFLFTALVVNFSMVISAIAFVAAAVVMALGFGFNIANLLDKIDLPDLPDEPTTVPEKLTVPENAERTVLHAVEVPVVVKEDTVDLAPAVQPPMPKAKMPMLADLYDHEDAMHLLGY
jgi:hypothetical protein